MTKFESLRREIASIVKDSEIVEDPEHSVRAWRWVLKLNPDASEELQIAALAHDIDRAVTPRAKQQPGETHDDYKKRHAARSAEIISKMMKKQGYDDKSIRKVAALVKKHEVGGDEDADFLMDADSISYFEYNVNFYIKRNSPKKNVEKIKYMFVRASDRAKKVISSLKFSPEVKKLFDKAMKEIEAEK